MIGKLVRIEFDEEYMKIINKYNIVGSRTIEIYQEIDGSVGTVLSEGVQKSLNIINGYEELDVYLVYVQGIVVPVEKKFIVEIKNVNSKRR